MGGSMVLRPHRSRHRPNKTVPPGHDESDFFCQFLLPYSACFDDTGSPPHIVCVLLPCLPRFISSSHPISRLLAYGFAFCYPATRISISPRSSPRYPRHGWTGRFMAVIRLTWAAILLASCGDGRRWMATEAVMSCLLDFWRAMSSPSHEMMRR